MNRVDFANGLRSGLLATDLVREATGVNPNIVTIAETEDSTYTRYGVMMAGDKMCALVILSIYPYRVGPDNMKRIRSGEPAGAVLNNMKRRQGNITVYSQSIKSFANLIYEYDEIGNAQEIFTGSLFDE